MERGQALARKFHEAYERLAPSFGYETRTETREFDPTTPNGKLMIAVCDELATTLLGPVLPDRFADDAIAEIIYNGWSERTGWVPWVARGNSQMQDVARHEARIRSQVSS